MRKMFNSKGFAMTGVSIIIAVLVMIATSGYGISYGDVNKEEAERSASLSDAQVIISCVNTHNATSEVDESVSYISYDDLMKCKTLSDFNSICINQITYIPESDFNIAKQYILEADDGSLTVNAAS